MTAKEARARDIKFYPPKKYDTGRYYIETESTVEAGSRNYIYRDGIVRRYQSDNPSVFFDTLEDAIKARKAFLTPLISLHAVYNMKDIS